MNKHTPGQWDIQEGELGTLYVFSGSLQVAELADCNDDSKANARLIASAPKLLAYLKRMESSYVLSLRMAKELVELIAQAEGINE